MDRTGLMPAKPAAPPSTAPARTAIVARSRSGLTVMMKTTPSAIPIRIDHDAEAVRVFTRPASRLIPVRAPDTAMRTHDVMPTTTQPFQPHCEATM